MTKEKKPDKEPAKPADFSGQEKKEIQVIERVIENREIASHDAFGKLSRAQVELIKKTVAKGASDDELKLFITICHGAQLNPFLKQAHLVPFWDSKDGVERRAIIVGIDGYRSIAESSGKYAGNDDPIYEGEAQISISVKEGQTTNKKNLSVPSKATVTVYKIVEGQRYGFTATARWSEYYPGEKKGYNWHLRPFLQLGKCAEALALRKAFPKLLSGIYAQEEMDMQAGAKAEQAKTDNRIAVVLKAIENSNLKQLKELKPKIKGSDKYDPVAKKEFLEKVDARIALLSEKEKPAEAATKDESHDS